MAVLHQYNKESRILSLKNGCVQHISVHLWSAVVSWRLKSASLGRALIFGACSDVPSWLLPHDLCAQMTVIPAAVTGGCFLSMFLSPLVHSITTTLATHLHLNPSQHFLHLPQLHLGKNKTSKNNPTSTLKNKWARWWINAPLRHGSVFPSHHRWRPAAERNPPRCHLDTSEAN